MMNGHQVYRDTVDHGYSWVILACSFYLFCLYSATLATYGIMLPEYVEYFGVSKSRAVVTQTLAYCAALITGVPVGWLVQRYNYRTIAVTGSAISSVGFILSGVVSSLELLYVTHGFLPGLGLMMYLVCASVAVTTSFEKRRTLALGIGVTGLGFGLLVWSPLIRFLLNLYGRRGTLLLFSGVHLNGIVAAALLRPKRKSFLAIRDKNGVTNEQPKSKIQQFILFLKGLTTCPCKNNFYLTNAPVLIYIIANALNTTGHLIPYLFIPARAQSVGVSKANSALLLSILGVSNIVARPLFGILGDFLSRFRTLMYGIACIGAGLLTAIGYTLGSFLSLAVYLVVQGLIAGGYMATFTAIIADLVPIERVSVANGIMSTCTLGTTAVIVPISGWLVDRTGSYASPFLVFGIVQAAAGSLAILVYILQRRSRRSLTEANEDI